MSVSVKSVRCPDCNAALEIEEGRKQCFCSYCGAKIELFNDNEYELITRHIDEAALEKARTEKEIELAKIKADADSEKRWFRVLVGIFWFVVVLAILTFFDFI